MDWVLEDPKAKAWDAVKQQLEVKFKRNLIGSSKNDYTYLLDTKYDYRLVYGEWDNDRQNDGGRGRVSRKVDESDPKEKKAFTVSFDQASFDGASYLSLGFALACAVLTIL